MAAFRRISDEVQKRKDAEAAAERVKRELSRAGVTLTPEQEATVIKLQSQYSDKMRELFRGGFGTSEADRLAMTDEARRAAHRASRPTSARQIPGRRGRQDRRGDEARLARLLPPSPDSRPGMGGDGMTR